MGLFDKRNEQERPNGSGHRSVQTGGGGSASINWEHLRGCAWTGEQFSLDGREEALNLSEPDSPKSNLITTQPDGGRYVMTDSGWDVMLPGESSKKK